MAQIIQQVLNESPEVSDAIKRLVTENSLPLDGANTDGWGNGFHGTIAATSDNTGLTFTVNAADSPQSPFDAFWQTYFTGAVSSALGMIGRAECMTFLKSRVPGANDQQGKIIKATCSSLGSILVSFFTAVITMAWAGETPDQTTLASDLGKAIATAFFGSVLWDVETYNWLTNSVLNVFIAFLGTLAVQTAWPWLQSTYGKVATILSNWSNPMTAVQAAVLAWRTPVSASTVPCDTEDAYGAPCVDAYSTTRALYATYNGPLYQVQRASDAQTTDIYPVAVGGVADAAAQDSFCGVAMCTMTKLYDQSPDWDDLTVPAGDHPAIAVALPIQVGGSNAYGIDVNSGVGYRDNAAQNTATNGDAEGMYMVASGTHVNAGCCFDFGNAETNGQDNGVGHMDAVNLTTFCGQNSQPCTGSGPWVQADLENGQWMGNGPNPANLGNNSDFVTAMLENDGQSTFALEGGNSQSGGLSTWWRGPLPTAYQPMKQEGAVILGTGGDNSNSDVGSFFEGAMTIGYPPIAADGFVQDNIVQADYTGNSGGVPPPPAGTITGPSGMCVDVIGDDTGTNGTPVDEWGCQPYAVDQHWTHNANGELETLGRCLNISIAQGVGGTGTGVAGDHLTLWDCNGSGVEEWVQQPDGTLVNPPTGLCVYGQHTNGYQLQVVNCNSADPNQQFAAWDAALIPPAGTITVPGGQCVDVSGDDTGTNSTPVDIWDCQAYAIDQHWTHNADGSLETLGRCLSISTAQGVGGTGTGVAGDRTVLWDCNGSDVERWLYEASGLMVNPATGLCLYGQHSNGYQLQVVNCNITDPAQLFSVNGGSPAVNTPSKKCVDVIGDDTGGQGAAVDLWGCQSYALDQHWTYGPNDSLRTLGLCLDTAGPSTAAGSGVVLGDCDGSSTQQWVQQSNGSVLNVGSGLCLDDPGGNTADGTRLEIWTCNGGTNQVFALGL
jgi:hypothetical protein